MNKLRIRKEYGLWLLLEPANRTTTTTLKLYWETRFTTFEEVVNACKNTLAMWKRFI